MVDKSSNATCVMFCLCGSYVKNLIHEVNLPPFGKLEVGITINNRVIYASRPALNSVPIVKNVRRRQSASGTFDLDHLNCCRKLTSPCSLFIAISFHCSLCSAASQRRILSRLSRYYSAWRAPSWCTLLSCLCEYVTYTYARHYLSTGYFVRRKDYLFVVVPGNADPCQ